jgi:hypothetical protein
LFGVRGVAVPPAGGAGFGDGEACAMTAGAAASGAVAVASAGIVCALAVLIAPANNTMAAHSAVMMRPSGREGCDASM